MLGSLRHVGRKVNDLDSAVDLYRKLGFEPIEIEHVRVCKITNKHGVCIELIEGNYDEHIAVNFYRDEDNNLYEIVKEV